MDKENNSKNNDAAQAQLKKNIILRDKRVCKPSTREKSKKLCDETHYRRKTPLAKSDSVILEFLGEVITECKDLIHQLHKNTMKIGKDTLNSKTDISKRKPRSQGRHLPDLRYQTVSKTKDPRKDHPHPPMKVPIATTTICTPLSLQA
ncbi:hypothetical protein JHK87_049525 [Glycine soja]|nr:hypothetical protein JHK87_049525 [Glycine soja]